MSAFIISKPTMDIAVMAIRATTCGPLDLSELGRQLYRMNLAAIMARYPDDTKESAPGPCDISDIFEHYEFTQRDPSKMNEPLDWAGDPGDDPFKLALRCLRYQCSEGDIPDTWAEYQQINDLIEAA